MNSIIHADNLTKEYKRVIDCEKDNKFLKIVRRKYEILNAINSISFSIAEGEMVGYLGLNGAGKSTTIKLLSGILEPTKGEIKVMGMNPVKDRRLCTQNTSTIFGQKNQLWWDLPVWDSIEMARYMYNIPRNIFYESYEYIDRFLEISEIKHIPVRQLSLGQKMKANLCFALIHSPQILFLDEPTIGLDLLTKQQVHDCIKKMNNERGITMLLTTHDVSDIENLCKRVILIDKGEIRFDNSLKRLRNEYETSVATNIHFGTDENHAKIKKFLSDTVSEYIWREDNTVSIKMRPEDFMRCDMFKKLNEEFVISKVLPEDDGLSYVLTTIYKKLEKDNAYE